MKTKQIMNIIATHSLVAIVVAGSIYLPAQYSKFQMKARSKEGLTLLNSAQIAMKATAAEEGAYPKTLKGSGFNPTGELHYNISLTEDTLDPSTKDIIPKSYYPFADGTKYQITVSGKLGPNTYHICKVGTETDYKCIWINTEIDGDRFLFQ